MHNKPTGCPEKGYVLPDRGPKDRRVLAFDQRQRDDLERFMQSVFKPPGARL